ALQPLFSLRPLSAGAARDGLRPQHGRAVLPGAPLCALARPRPDGHELRLGRAPDPGGRGADRPLVPGYDHRPVAYHPRRSVYHRLRLPLLRTRYRQALPVRRVRAVRFHFARRRPDALDHSVLAADRLVSRAPDRLGALAAAGDSGHRASHLYRDVDRSLSGALVAAGGPYLRPAFTLV